MGRRLDLHEVLVGVLGSRNVYYQPTTQTKMSYPAIVYKRDYILNQHADNKPYSQTHRYMLTVIDRDPDSALIDGVAALPLCTFVRHFTADDLNHDIFNIYF